VDDAKCINVMTRRITSFIFRIYELLTANYQELVTRSVLRTDLIWANLISLYMHKFDQNWEWRGDKRRPQ